MSKAEDLQTTIENALVERRNPLAENLPGDFNARRTALQVLLDRQPGIVIERQYPQVIRMLQEFGLLGIRQPEGARLLTPAAVKESFSVEQLKLAVSPAFQHPTFLVVPPVDFSHLINAINNHRLPNQNTTLLDENLKNDEGARATHGWTPVILEGARGARIGSELSGGPAAQENLVEFVGRVQRARHATSEHLCGIDRRMYAMLMMISMMEAQNPSQLIDTRTSTILDADPALVLQPEIPHGIPIGKYWREGNQARFSMYDAMGIGEDFPPGGHWMRHAVIGQTIE